jgi:hypothetical protein
MFSYENYPVYVTPGQNVFLVADEHRTDDTKMRKLMEVYSFALPLAPQLDERRSAHYEMAPSVDSTPVEFEYTDHDTMLEAVASLGRLLAEPHPDLPHWRQAISVRLSCIVGLTRRATPPPSGERFDHP